MADLLFNLNAVENVYNSSGHKFPIGNFWNSIRKGWKTVLFMEAMRNLAWSRGYLWYAELDGVPNPFHRGGVLGLPCKSITFKIAGGENFSVDTSTTSFNVPRSCGELGEVSLDLYEDEQGTLTTFFERWFNEVYNPYYGVLPVTEACKQLSIYRQKASRRNIVRNYFDLDKPIDGVKSVINKIRKGAQLPKTTDAYELLVYPSGSFNQTLTTDANDIITLNVTLQVAYIINQDFGNPTINNGVKSLFGVALNSGDTSEGYGWLDKIADYI